MNEKSNKLKPRPPRALADRSAVGIALARGILEAIRQAFARYRFDRSTPATA